MNIILDTNVVISDCGYFFNSRDFGILIEYLDQTASKLLLPQIIIDELISCYEDELEKANCLIDKATKLLNPLKHDLKTSFKNKENLNSYKSFIFKDFLLYEAADFNNCSIFLFSGLFSKSKYFSLSFSFPFPKDFL